LFYFAIKADINLEEEKFKELRTEIKNKIIEPIVSNLAKQTIECFENLNSSLSENQKTLLIKRVNKRRERSSLLENKIIMNKNNFESINKHDYTKEIKKIEESRFILNPCVQAEVELFEPATYDEINHTNNILNNKIESIHDENAVFHILNEIAKKSNLNFVVVDSSKKEKKGGDLDIYRRPIDTALENESVTESTLHLLGSNVPGHSIKGFSLHLEGSLDDIPKDPKKKAEFGQSIKEKLSKIYKTSPDNIVIHSFTSGTITINYTVRDRNDNEEDNIIELKKIFPNFLSCEIHPSLLYMRIDTANFASAYNRDYSIDDNCPKNESRGCQPYYAPAGWHHYNLSVEGKYDSGNNI
jgi:hypothetical protein